MGDFCYTASALDDAWLYLLLVYLCQESCNLKIRLNQPPLALAGPLSRFAPLIGGASAFYSSQLTNTHGTTSHHSVSVDRGRFDSSISLSFSSYLSSRISFCVTHFIFRSLGRWHIYAGDIGTGWQSTIASFIGILVCRHLLVRNSAIRATLDASPSVQQKA